MVKRAELQRQQEQLQAMILELRTNRTILNHLRKCYGTFLFTGGVVPREPWGLLATASYLQSPFAADRISAAAMGRYQELAKAIMDLGQIVTEGPRPRTRRCRHDIAERFERDCSEIQALGAALESDFEELGEALRPST